MVSKLVKESHNAYLNDVIGSSLTENPKKFWSYVRSCKSENIGIPPLKNDNSSISVNDKDKAESLNSYFHSVFTQEQLPTPNIIGTSSFPSIPDFKISTDGVYKQLSQLNPKKACGPDEIPAKVLKEASRSISHWLSFIFQQSYESNTIPTDWSNALVTAIFKKGKKSDPANYRPISLTCICCKIMEHIILSHMAKHLSLNNILIDQQHGFREQFSCETQLISAIHDWAKGINFRSQTDVILLDFSKAFDSVPHERLLVKLDFYGIRGKMLNWIRAFLTNRKQKVSVNGVLSSSRPVVSGVPQGSVLGPVLLLLFINDISNSIRSNLRLFADDCVLYKEVATQQDCQILQQDLHLLSHWSTNWQLSFNVSKCYHLGITRKKIPIEFNYSLASLSQVYRKSFLYNLSRYNSLPTTYLGTNIVTTLAKRQILLLGYLDVLYLAVPPK